MLCEPAEDNGWDCLTKENGEWQEYGNFDAVTIEGTTQLPIVSGKVIFDKENCKVKDNRLFCETN